MTQKIALSLLLAALATQSTLAAATPEQAGQLGATLTPMGAETAGNADGVRPGCPSVYRHCDAVSGDPLRTKKPGHNIGQILR